MTFVVIVWLVAAGFACATVYTAVTKKTLGSFVAALIEIDAVGEANAIDPERLGTAPSSAVKSALKRGGVFAKTVSVTEEGRYYINPDRLAAAKTFYGKEDNILIKTVVYLVLIAAVAGLFTFLYSAFETAISGFITNVFGAN